MSSVVVRDFVGDDSAPVVDLILSIQRQEFGLSITAADQPDLAAIPDFYQTGAGGFWVATLDDVIVGSVALKDIGGSALALRKMFVAPAGRSAAGAAMALLETALSHARAHAVSDIYLGTTDRFLAAHRFYEKNGFAPVAPESLPTAFPRMAVDTRFYRLRL